MSWRLAPTPDNLGLLLGRITEVFLEGVTLRGEVVSMSEGELILDDGCAATSRNLARVHRSS